MNVPVIHKVCALSFRKILGRLPIEVEHLFRRPDILGGITMAVETEGHTQRLHLPHFIQLVNLAMAVDAAYAAVDMH